MDVPSTPVTSRQTGVHPRLVETVLRHRDHPWRKPVADHSRKAFEGLAARILPGPMILDSGCGTGMSTGVLAREYPSSWVLGVDKSLARLGRVPADLPPNALLVRMDLEDFWLLAFEAGWRFQRQCFYYPNPWPKPEQRLRRWPFHPVLPTALACGGTWEVRTNWEIYAREFAQAFALLTGHYPQVGTWMPQVPQTLFERKYLGSGHILWRWEAEVPGGPKGPG